MTRKYTISDSDIHNWINTHFDQLTISSWSDEEYTHYANQARVDLVKQISEKIVEEMIFTDECARHKPYISYQETDYDTLYSY